MESVKFKQLLIGFRNKGFWDFEIVGIFRKKNQTLIFKPLTQVDFNILPGFIVIANFIFAPFKKPELFHEAIGFIDYWSRTSRNLLCH